MHDDTQLRTVCVLLSFALLELEESALKDEPLCPFLPCYVAEHVRCKVPLAHAV